MAGGVEPVSIVNQRMADILIIVELIQAAGKIEDKAAQKEEIGKLDRELKAAYIYLDQALRGENQNEFP